MPRKAKIFIIDDHLEMAQLLSDQLTDRGYGTEAFDRAADAIVAANAAPPAMVITDLRMADLDGFDVIDAMRALDENLPVLVMTAFGSVETAVEAIKRGAYQYVTKPFRFDEVLVHVTRGLESRRLHLENARLRDAVNERTGLGALLGRSAAMHALYQACERVAPAIAPVLIRGESGSGKELVARAIHQAGPRANRAFIAVNCTALPEALLESELFGHAKGSFTGATVERRGLFLEADGGTLFLDEIGDMAPNLQARVLRVIEDGEIRPVGADGSRKVDVRLLAATHQDLERRVEQGLFRPDLFYRLNVIPLRVPDLDGRREDIPVLVDAFIEQARARNPHSDVQRFSADLLGHLVRRPWPGNVRELKHLVERLVIMGAGPELTLASAQQVAGDAFAHASDPPGGPVPLAEAQAGLLTLRDLESRYIAWVVEQVGGNKTKAAEILGVDASTVHRKMRE